MSRSNVETECKSELLVCIVLLAAGRSSRMKSGTRHKLLAIFDGAPLVRNVAVRAIASKAAEVTVVTGFRPDDIIDCISDLDLTIVNNPNFEAGIASSLSVGLRAVQDRAPTGVLVLHGDMPGITTSQLNRLIDEFVSANGLVVVRASCLGIPGNPVILPRPLLKAAGKLVGDLGARKLIENSGIPVVNVEIGEAAIIDVDTEEQLRTAGGAFAN